jgi:hypothetical protein
MKLHINLKEITFELSPKKDSDNKIKFISKKEIYSLFLALSALSVAAWYWFFRLGLTLSYNDARSHLNIARRVVESLQPGAAQFGSVWLPLFHILEIPFIWNDFLWRTGIAGSIVSMTAYVIGGVILALLTKELRFNRTATYIAVIVYAFNPNLLFLQTTPMTESLLITLSLGAVYFIVKWSKEFDIKYLISSAILVFLATLTRYDGWFLCFFMAIFIYIVCAKKYTKQFAQGNFILFCTAAGFGILLWALWNLLIFNDPLYFAFGEFSAHSQQELVEEEGRLLSKGNLPYSTFLYLLTLKDNIGIWLSLLSIAGAYLFFSYKKIPTRVKFAAGLLAVPLIFNILSLFIGHSVIHLPYVAPYTWFNVRYGLLILPAVAVAIGFLAYRSKMATILIIIALFLQTYIVYSTNNVITIQDGVRGASGDFLDDVGKWISANVDDGLILVAASSNDGLLFIAQKPMSQFITEGAQKYWKESIKDPRKHAKWVVMQKGDLVDRNLRNNKIFLNNYDLMYKGNFAHIYKLNKNSKAPLTEEELP